MTTFQDLLNKGGPWARAEIIGNALLLQGDCLSILPTLPKVNAVITDPPYNVGKNYGPMTDDSMPSEAYAAWLSNWLRSCFMVSDNVVFTPGNLNAFVAERATVAAGARVHRILGWHRKEFAGDLFTSGPAISWELVLWATTAIHPFWNKRFGHAGRDFLVVNSIHGNPMSVLHPCPKPIEVMIWLAGLFAPEGGSVADPCMGTGTTGEAVVRAGRKFIGIEIEPRYYEIACERIENAQRQQRMFA